MSPTNDSSKSKTPELLPDVVPRHVRDFYNARELIESFVVAVMLALLLRTFLVEPYIIPTGSMAPTLFGRHRDVNCPECQIRYRANASIERDKQGAVRDEVVDSVRCPNCGYKIVLEPTQDWNQASFDGDRIVVDKVAYEFKPPSRWDVIVFKYPENAIDNFIKRLIALPGEAVQIQGGDIFIGPAEGSEVSISRKPDRAFLSLLQTVYDHDHQSPTLNNLGWPVRWQRWDRANKDWDKAALPAGQTSISFAGDGEQVFRYRHFEPNDADWDEMRDGKLPAFVADWQGGLITDSYAYNSFSQRKNIASPGSGGDEPACPGQYWVRDLAIECEWTIESVTDENGFLMLELVRSGERHQAVFNPKNGEVQLRIVDRNGELAKFSSDEGNELSTPMATTKIQGPGSYRIRFANVDQELRLWVNDVRVEFPTGSTYLPQKDDLAIFTNQEPLDLAPVAVISNGVKGSVGHLVVKRDKYYVAVDEQYMDEYSESLFSRQYSHARTLRMADGSSTMAMKQNAVISLLQKRGLAEFTLEDGQYFVLGDNSPQSSDARLWDRGRKFVPEHLLIGRAIFVYWPHTWWNPFCMPDLGEARPIR